MPSNVNVNLDVRNFPSNGSDGYTNSTASNGAIYSYQYSGGNGPGGGGNAEFNGRGNANVVVQMHSDQRYTISNVVIANDPNQQLSWAGRAPTTATIHNQNSVVQTAYYEIVVFDGNAGCSIPCDPQIVNK